MRDIRGKRVWIATEDFPPKLGGISRWSANTASASSELGASVTVLAKRAVAGVSPVACARVSVEGRSFCALRHFHFMRAMRREMRRQGAWPDAILCSTWRVAEGALMARASCPVAAMVHGLEVFAGYTPMLRARRRRVLERVSLAAAASRFTADRLSSVAPRARVFTGINGIETRVFNPDGRRRERQSRVQLVSAGRMVPRKRFDLVLDSLKLLLDSGIDAGLWLAGGGPLESALREQAAPLGDRVEFLGEVTDDELAVLYRSADLFLSPCQSDVKSGDVEGFGLTFIEASACGTAVAGLSEGGVTDAVEHGVSGILSTRGEFARDVSNLCRNPDLICLYGKQGLERARRDFDVRKVVLKLLSESLGGGGGEPVGPPRDYPAS